MASFQQVNYCKNCKTNVSIDEKSKCKRCGGTQISKTWSVRFRYVNEDQKEVQKRLSGYTTKKEANEEYLKFMATAKQYQKLQNPSHELLFCNLVKEYFEFSKPRTKESSYISMNSRIQNHILPYFKDMKVIKIEPRDILVWQNKLTKYNPNYQKDIRRYLTSLLNYAEKYYKIPNQIRYVDSIRTPRKKKEIQIWTPEQFNKFILKIHKIEYKTFFELLYYSGARLGEILALKWSDVNFVKGIISINKNITRKTSEKSFAITTPKNDSSYREISLPVHITTMLKELKKYEQENNIENFIFFGNKPLSATTLTRIKDNAIQKINLEESERDSREFLPKIRLHDFRHSHASLLISSGISIVAVSHRLGHSNIEQTLNTYSHLMPKEENKIITTLNSIFLGTNLGTK